MNSINKIKKRKKEKKSLARPPGLLGQNFCCCCCFVASRHLKKKKVFSECVRNTTRQPESVQLKSSIVAYLLHDFFRGMIVFAVCRSFLPVAFVRVSHDLLGQYARRERSLQQYVVTYTCSATVPANAALIFIRIHSLGAMHARNGVPAACA